MEFKEIITISGQPGLFRYVAQGAHGIIVESLIDGKRMNATGSAKISALAEIALFTDDGEMPLSDVLTEMHKRTDKIAPKASPDQLKAFFAQLIPSYDRDRVHVSDMKKVFSWFNILIGAGMTEFRVEEQETGEDGKPAKADAPKEKVQPKPAAAPKAQGSAAKVTKKGSVKK